MLLRRVFYFACRRYGFVWTSAQINCVPSFLCPTHLNNHTGRRLHNFSGTSCYKPDDLPQGGGVLLVFEELCSDAKDQHKAVAVVLQQPDTAQKCRERCSPPCWESSESTGLTVSAEALWNTALASGKSKPGSLYHSCANYLCLLRVQFFT